MVSSSQQFSYFNSSLVPLCWSRRKEERRWCSCLYWSQRNGGREQEKDLRLKEQEWEGQRLKGENRRQRGVRLSRKLLCGGAWEGGKGGGGWAFKMPKAGEVAVAMGGVF